MPDRIGWSGRRGMSAGRDGLNCTGSLLRGNRLPNFLDPLQARVKCDE